MYDEYLRNSVVQVSMMANGSLIEHTSSPFERRVNEVKDCFVRVAKLLPHVRFPGYNLHVVRGFDAVYVYVTYTEPDVQSGVDETQQSRRWVIEPEWNEGQILQTVFKALLTSMEHRTREHFTYDGFAVLNPHQSLEQLVELARGQARPQLPDTLFVVSQLGGISNVANPVQGCP
jgi:hypothetical protein